MENEVNNTNNQTVTNTEVQTPVPTPTPAPVQAEAPQPQSQPAPQQQPAAPAPKPTEQEQPKESKKEVKEKKKKEKPVKEKKEHIGFSTFLLLILICGLVVTIMYTKDLRSLPAGVLDIDELDIKEMDTREKLDIEKIIKKIDVRVYETAINYLLQDDKKTYQEYVLSLDNSTKLYLAGVLNQKLITLESLTANLHRKFGFDVKIEGQDVKSLKNNKVLFTYDKSTSTFNKVNEDETLEYKPFKVDGEFLILEADDYVGEPNDFYIRTYGLFIIRDQKGEHFYGKNFEMPEGMSFDELKDKLPTIYSDQKEKFEVIDFYLLKGSSGYVLHDIKFGN